VAIGDSALYNNGIVVLESISATKNTAIGSKALFSNTNGHINTANGANALYSNTSGHGNTATGHEALYSNTDGSYNAANGEGALSNNTTGSYNAANGRQALFNNTEGVSNTASGESALSNNTTGSFNTAVGYIAGPYITTTNLSNTTALGYEAITTADNTVVIGNIPVTSIGGYANWSNLSDGRYKNNIREDVEGIDFIMGLRPITYNLDVRQLSRKLGEDIRIDENGNRFQEEVSPEMVSSREKKASKRNTGFVAQEVENLANELGFDFSGIEKPENEQSMYRLRYAEFVVPIVKAMQEQQELIVELQNEMDELKRGLVK